MDYIFKNGLVYHGGTLRMESIGVCNGVCVPIEGNTDAKIFDCSGLVLLPGFVDVHVHLREPGFLYKETIATGSSAAARGGYTTLCAMPNLIPAPDTKEHLNIELEAIKKDAVIRVIPYGTISMERKGVQLSDMTAMAAEVAGYSDDGSGVQSPALMLAAMEQAKKLHKCIAAHCEDNTLLRNGYIHDGAYAKAHGHAGICSESEWGQLARDLDLVRKTDCAYHVCHISTKESVQLLRQAKAEGLNVTCETAPHYLLLDETNLQDDGRFKMNPPLRTPQDRESLLAGILDGTIDMIATDHAPHSIAEKSRGLKGSAMGIVGIETAFPLLYTYLVASGKLPFSRLVELLHDAPSHRFGLDGGLEIGQRADFTIFDLRQRDIIEPLNFISKGKSTPFAGWEVNGRCRMTVSGGSIAWSDGTLEATI